MVGLFPARTTRGSASAAFHSFNSFRIIAFDFIIVSFHFVSVWLDPRRPMCKDCAQEVNLLFPSP